MARVLLIKQSAGLLDKTQEFVPEVLLTVQISVVHCGFYKILELVVEYKSIDMREQFIINIEGIFLLTMTIVVITLKSTNITLLNLQMTSYNTTYFIRHVIDIPICFT